jgi:hypothetical protein
MAYRFANRMIVIPLAVLVLSTLGVVAADAQTPNAVSPDKARVYVYRYKQLLGAAAEPRIYCDQVELVRMDNGRYFSILLPPGKHLFRSSNKQSGIEIDVKAGQTYYLRVDMVSGFYGGPHDQLVKADPEQAAYELKQLKPLGNDKIKDRSVLVSDEVASTRESSGPSREVLTNQNVIALKAAGLSDETIIAKIRSSGTKFSLATQDLIELKKANISDSVIQAMIDASK